MITVNKKLRVRLLIQNSIFILLLLVLIFLLGYLGREHSIQWDISQNGRNTLSQASVEVLQKMKGPITVTIYAKAQDVRLGDIRKIISDFLILYQRIKPNLVFTFIDPTEFPDASQKAGISVNGEMVVSFNGRSEHLTIVNEQVFTNLLIRLLRSGEKLIMNLSGHGERKLDGRANHDLGEFGKQLTTKGLKFGTLNLAIAQDVPTNANVLVIASPQVDLLKGEIDKILAYIDRGGNLLWLIDQESLHGLQPLAERLGLILTPGVVVDPQAQQLKAPITFALGANYGQHPITRNFSNITVFPFARQINFNEREEWKNVSLIEVAQNGWVETGKLEDNISFDKMYDVAGPISIAAALSRTLQDREQHIVIIGSGHFLANTYLGNGSNLSFGINLINWLVNDENLITIQPQATLDSNLSLNKSALTLIATSFLIVLPIFFFAGGLTVWWRRKRKRK